MLNPHWPILQQKQMLKQLAITRTHTQRESTTGILLLPTHLLKLPILFMVYAGLSESVNNYWLIQTPFPAWTRLKV